MQKIEDNSVKMVSILIFGAGSKLSYSLNKELKENEMYSIVCVSSKDKPEWITNQKWIVGDILDFNFVKDTIQEINPNIIVNLAAYTNVDGCEDDKFISHQINYEFPSVLSEMCLKESIKLIHISTDYVFDGKVGLYKIEDTPSESQLSWYALSKRDSEIKVLESLGCVIRTNVLYDSGNDSPDFIKWLKEQFETNKEISIVHDQFNNPTSYGDLSKSIIKVIEKDIRGIIHTGGKDWASRWELAQVFALSQDIDPESLNMKAVSSKEIQQKAIRPMFGGLDISESESILDIKFSGIYDYFIHNSNFNTEETNSHFLIFTRFISVLRKIPNDLRRNVFIKCKKNPHKTISILIESKSIWSEIEIGLNSYSGLIYRMDDANLNLHIGDIYTDDTIENFIKSLQMFLTK